MKSTETGNGAGEENIEGLEASEPLFRPEMLAGAVKEKMLLAGTAAELEISDCTVISTDFCMPS